MARRDERRIEQRLARVEALHRGATTPGEREAAARARERLLTHLAEVRGDDEIARFCAEHVAELAVAPAPPPPPDPLPDVATVLGVLVRWEAGEWSTDDVQAWAESIVDRVDFGDDPGTLAVAEVTMQLAGLPRVGLRPRHVPGIRRFLRDGDLPAWFALLATAMEERRASSRARVRRADPIGE
jgi:hypothetical protein